MDKWCLANSWGHVAKSVCVYVSLKERKTNRQTEKQVDRNRQGVKKEEEEEEKKKKKKKKQIKQRTYIK